jgi:hypothetical protein
MSQGRQDKEAGGRRKDIFRQDLYRSAVNASIFYATSEVLWRNRTSDSNRLNSFLTAA